MSSGDEAPVGVDRAGATAGRADGGVPSGPPRPLVMGILNVTPDSFSDGGRYAQADDAIAHGLDLLAEGADYIDVGGESTRPGAGRVSPAAEEARVVGVVSALAEAGARVSVDTTRARVARAACAAGAVLVNDVSGGLADPAMARTVADMGVDYVVMHSRGPSDRMAGLAQYDDVVADVCDELSARVDAVVRAGVDPARVIIDPGLGFAKTAEQNWELLVRVDDVLALGFPVLIGASRKRFLGSLLADETAKPRPPEGRDDATVALTALLAARGVWGVRTHTVRGQRDAIDVALRLARDGVNPLG